MNGRIPPQAVEVEAAVLGAALIDPSAATALLGHLTPGHFYDPRHRAVCRAVATVTATGKRADLLSVSESLKESGDYDRVRGSYLSELTTHVATTDAASIENHARIIFEKALLREGIHAMQSAIGRAYEAGADPFDVLESVQRSITEQLASAPGAESMTLGAAVDEAIERALEAEEARKAGKSVTGIPTGYVDLDDKTNGWQRGDMTVIAARPSMGKSGIALGSALAAAKEGHAVAFFTLEMKEYLFAQRAIAAAADVDAFNIRSGRLMPDDWERIERAAPELRSLPVHLQYTPGLTPEQFVSQVARMKDKLGDALSLVIVDYLQLMGSSKSTSANNREQEVAAMSRTMKRVSGDYDVAVLALSQLSRQCENRQDKRPQLNDLRESGTIEQDADVVLFIYRAERYGITRDDITPNGRRMEVDTTGLAEVIIGKQRSGPIGTVYLGFDASRTRFYDRSFEDAPTGESHARTVTQSYYEPIEGGF